MAAEELTITYMDVDKLSNNDDVPEEVFSKLEENNVIINCFTDSTTSSNMTYKSELCIYGEGEAQGYFSINGKGFLGQKKYGNPVMDLNITIKDGQQGKGYSNYLIHALCEYILKKNGKTGG